jgi:ATP-dependent DNA helicase RecQ
LTTSDIGAPSKLSDPQEVLERVFGYSEFRPGQQKIIDAILRGQDCIGVMPTGAGKSLTFQVPAKILPGTVLVIRRDELLTSDTVVGDDDVLELRPVMSGGAA